MTSTTNPYVGPRTFTEKDGDYYFGREQEARDLTARIVSERLLLFYAQSGAGKSSLINTRVIPRLRDEEGFMVLPVGRVSGELPPGVEAVENIFAFNLMNSLDQSSGDPGRLADVCLNDFLARLAGETAVGEEGSNVMRWVYHPEIKIGRGEDAQPASGPRFALVIDQFEELVTSNPDHWQEREAFIRQLNEALIGDPNLWVILTLREDYIAALDPYAPLVLNRMRARFYMERMDGRGALEAVRRPAAIGGRPFAPGVAKQLVDDLRQVRVPGREETVPSQYVEPVQLQVVCYQLWENLEQGGGGDQITAEDLEESGDVDQALTEFYEETLLAVLADPECPEVDERRMRRWFDKELITPAGTRGLVHQGQRTTGGLPNEVVRMLQERFLVRTEVRAGATWVELVHDRFVKPIHESNNTWFDANLSVLQRQALLWEREERSPDLLLRGDALHDAEAWAKGREHSLPDYEMEFLASSQIAGQAAEEREQRRTRLIATLAAVAVLVALLFLLFAVNSSRQEAEVALANAQTAAAARSTVENAATAVSQEAKKAAEEAENARRQESAAVTAEADAKAAQGTAEASQFEAVEAQVQAETSLGQAQAASTAEAEALATSAANLELAFAILTRQSSELALVTGDVVDAPPPIVVEELEPSPTATAPATAGGDGVFLDTGDIGVLGFGFTSSDPGTAASPPGTPTPTPAPTATPEGTAETPAPAAAPEETAVYSEVDLLVAQWEQIQATRAMLAEEADETSSADVVANWIGMTVRSEPGEEGVTLSEVEPWGSAQVLDHERDRWLLVETEEGVSGWVDGRLRVYMGDAEAIPGGLRYRLISDRDDLPFIFGKVAPGRGTADRYQLRLRPGFEEVEVIEVPPETEVIVLLANLGEDSDWMLVTLADIEGDRLIRTGYLPQNLIRETRPFFRLSEDALVSETGVEACSLSAGDVVTAGNIARMWSEPDVVNGSFKLEVEGGEMLLVLAADPVWGPIRRDIDASGWWWLLETGDDGSGWIWQNRIVECGVE